MWPSEHGKSWLETPKVILFKSLPMGPCHRHLTLSQSARDFKGITVTTPCALNASTQTQSLEHLDSLSYNVKDQAA